MVTYAEVSPMPETAKNGSSAESTAGRKLDALLPAGPAVRDVELRSLGALVPTDAAESFRRAYTVAGFDDAGILAVCSAVDGEGKTTVSLGLARTIARDCPERRVLLVETNVARPTLAAELGASELPGLVEQLAGVVTPEQAYHATELPNLYVMPVGGAPGVQGRPLRSPRLPGTLMALRREFHVVIFDVVSLLTNSDGVALAELADSVVLVVRAGVTPVDLVAGATSLVDATKLRGVILNGVEPAAPSWLRRLLGRR